MKFYSIFCPVFFFLAFILSGCTRAVVTGIDPSMVPPYGVTYDQTNSSPTSLGFYWEVDDAIEAGAVSFTAQIIKSEELGGNAYTGRDSQTFPASSRPNDGAVFNGLSTNSKYYARVRANYPRSVYSNWVYVTNPDGTPAVIKLGKGIVNESIQTITGASSRVVAVSSSTAVLEWSVTDFTSSEVDFSTRSSITLYNDEDCSDLFVSWDIADGSLYRGDSMRFVFSGLEPETDYWFVAEISVADAEGEESVYTSDPLKVTTDRSQAAGMPSYASEGQILLFQDFSELIWGGDAVNRAVGYSATNRSSVSSLKVARGWNPVGDSEYGFYLCDPGTEMGLYNSIGKALQGSGATLAQWAELREDNSVVGMVCARPGTVKIGASQKVGSLVTPQLSALTGIATVEVSFKASPYGTSIETLDPLETSVRLLDGVTVTSNIVTGAAVNNVVKTFELANDTAMKDYSFTIHNVTPTSRLAIGPERSPGETGQHRMLLDDICVKVVKYGETDIEVATPVVTLSAGEGMLMANWAACTNASSYDVEYRIQGETSWKSAGNTTFTSLTVRGLFQETVYEVRVRAKYSDKYTSSWSRIVTVRTPAVSSTVSVTSAVVTESQLGFKWNSSEDIASDITTPYLVELFRDASCTDLVVRLVLGAYGIPDENEMKLTNAVKSNPDARPMLWNTSNGPCFVFCGLNPSTSYTLRVTDRNLQVSGKCTASTAVSDLVELPSGKAAAGSIVLYENFSELVWGGLPCISSTGYGMPGVNSERRSTLDSFRYISGTDPLADDAFRFWLCAPGKDYGLLNTTWRAVAKTRLKDWAAISENYTGSAAGSLCGMAGMIKLGASSSWVQIVTPALDCLSGNAKIEVSFDMCPYTGSGQKADDPLDAVVKVLENVSTGTKGDMHQAVLSCDEVQTKAFVLEGGVPDLKRYTFTFENVKPGSRIAVGTIRPADAQSGQRRAFIDNIRIKVLKYNK